MPCRPIGKDSDAGAGRAGQTLKRTKTTSPSFIT